MENGTLNLDQNELQIIERGVGALNRAKRKLRTTRLVVWGVLIFVFIGSLIFVPMKYDLEEKLGYSGPRPSFEYVEGYIMNRLFNADYIKDEIEQDEDMDPLKRMALRISSGHYEFTQTRTAVEFDYARMKFNGVFRVRNESVDPDLKKTDMYKEAREEARVLFEAEMDRREASARIDILTGVAILLVLAALYALIAYQAVKNSKINGKLRLKQICDGEITVIPCTMIGRKAYHSRSFSSWRIEVRTEDGEERMIKVLSQYYQQFVAGKKCYAICYPGLDADEDFEYLDLVWGGMAK